MGKAHTKPRTPVEHLVWRQGVAGSSPATRTTSQEATMWWQIFAVLWCPAVVALLVALVWVVEKLDGDNHDDWDQHR